MKKNSIAVLIGSLLTFSTVTHAATTSSFRSLTNERFHVASMYLTYLQSANYKDIVSLFVKDGVVVSTSRGEVNAKEFFYNFLPEIQSAEVKQRESFNSAASPSSVLERFHFKFTFKNGETHEGEYIDEFVFAEGSAKITAVYMFENLHFNS